MSNIFYCYRVFYCLLFVMDLNRKLFFGKFYWIIYLIYITSCYLRFSKLPNIDFGKGLLTSVKSVLNFLVSSMIRFFLNNLIRTALLTFLKFQIEVNMKERRDMSVPRHLCIVFKQNVYCFKGLSIRISIHVHLWSDFSMLLALAFLWLSVFWAQCEKVSPKPGLKLFREDYKSVQETCIAVGFVKNSCSNDTKIGIFIIHSFTSLYETKLSSSVWFYNALYS